MAALPRPESARSVRGTVYGPLTFAVGLCVLLVCSVPARAQTPIVAGYRDFSYGTVPHSTPTGEKPESKIWWNDGVWWGSLWSVQANGYRIHRFNVGTQSWADTGTAIDSRPNSRADVFWDSDRQLLYVVSHVFSSSAKASTSSSNWGRLYRFSYNSTTQAYALQSGFPVNITRGLSEAVTIAKDSTQRLWVTYVEAGRVKLNWSGASDFDWGLPVDLPVTSSQISVDGDDISAVIAFDGDSVGVMWSNQNTRRTSFAIHRDVDPPSVWQPIETVLPSSNCSGACADDHMNLKATTDGRVFAALKTSLGTGEPLVMLGVRSTTGDWTTYTYGLAENHHTRPIVQLDESNNRLYMFATNPESGGAVYYKTSPLDNISFAPGLGTLFIDSSTDLRINNASSTKQNVNATTGLLVIACDQDSRFYVHNYLQLGAAPQAPAAPTGLNATALSSTQIELTWNDNANNETGFSVERDGGGGFTAIASRPANATSFIDTTVAPGTFYNYRVRAVNTGVFSGYSNQANATTPPAGPTAPAAPSGLAAPTVGSNAVTLTWTDNSSNETAFHIERALGGGAFAEISGSPVGSNITTLADHSVTPSTSYRYRVRAENAGLFSVYSAELPVTTSGTGGGNPTSSIKDATFEGGLTDPATGVDSVAGTVTLETASPLKGTRSARIATTSSWLEETFTATNDLYVSFYLRLTALPAADARLVLISNSGTTVGNLLLRTTGALRLRNGSTTIGSDSPALTVGQLYRVGVHQQRGAGTNAVLEAFLALADNPFTTSFARTTIGTWTTATDRFRLGATTGTVNVVVDDIRLDAFAMPPASGQAPSAPAAPTGLTADAISPTRIDLAWADNATDETGYSVERSASGGAFAVVASPAANATSFSDTTVLGNTAYTYRVRAVNTGVFSGYSNNASATTPTPTSTAPAAPSGLNATAISASRVDLAWTDNATNETGYRVERSDAGGPFAVVASPAANATSISDTTVVAATSYTYRVRAENTGVFSGYSNESSATTPALPAAPSAPTNLVAPTVTATSVTLTWTDNSANETAFHIERATAGGAFGPISASPVGVNVTTVTDTVAANTSYKYRVRAENAGAFSGYSNELPVTTPPTAGGSSSIKNATFEDGLTDLNTGVDSVAGTATLETVSPLKGTRSARIATTSSWLEETFTAVSDLYVSFYLRLNALPTADARLVLISSSGTTIGNILLRTTGALRLRNASTSIGVDSPALTVGQLYRIGVHQQRGTGTDAVLEAYLATADAAFGPAFARTTAGTWVTASDRLRIGSTTGTVNVVVDDLRLDAFAMPVPSP